MRVKSFVNADCLARIIDKMVQTPLLSPSPNTARQQQNSGRMSKAVARVNFPSATMQLLFC